MKAIYNEPRNMFNELSDFITKTLKDADDLKEIQITPEMKKLLEKEIKLTWKEKGEEGEMQLHEWKHETYDTYGNGGYNYLEWSGVFQMSTPYKRNKYGDPIRTVKVVVKK